MATKVTVISTPKNRVAINNQVRQTVRTVGVIPETVNTLRGLSDVDASDLDNNEILVYDEVQNKFVIKTIPEVDGGSF